MTLYSTLIHIYQKSTYLTDFSINFKSGVSNELERQEQLKF
jgi:hypothetical protein